MPTFGLMTNKTKQNKKTAALHKYTFMHTISSCFVSKHSVTIQFNINGLLNTNILLAYCNYSSISEVLFVHRKLYFQINTDRQYQSCRGCVNRTNKCITKDLWCALYGAWRGASTFRNLVVTMRLTGHHNRLGPRNSPEHQILLDPPKPHCVCF